MTFTIREGEHLVLPLGWYTMVYTIPSFVQGRYYDGLWTEEEMEEREVSRKVAILDSEDMSSFMKMYLPWSEGPSGIRQTSHGVLHLERIHAPEAEAGLLLPPPLDLEV
jgi:hypothetical protein